MTDKRVKIRINFAIINIQFYDHNNTYQPSGNGLSQMEFQRMTWRKELSGLLLYRIMGEPGESDCSASIYDRALNLVSLMLSLDLSSYRMTK